MADMAHPYHQKPGIVTSLSMVANEAMNLVRGETALARAEAKLILKQIAAALVMAVVGTALVMAALVIVLGAIATALAEAGMSPALAAALVGGAAILLGALLVNAAKSQLSSDSLMPSTSIKQLNRDAEVLKEIGK